MEAIKTTLQDEGYEGVEVTLGRCVYVAPPLSLKAMRVLMPKIMALSATGAAALVTDEMFDTLSELIYTALKRNYPALTMEAVEEGLDIKNMHAAMSAILSASGLTPGNLRAATSPMIP